MFEKIKTLALSLSTASIAVKANITYNLDASSPQDIEKLEQRMEKQIHSVMSKMQNDKRPTLSVVDYKLMCFNSYVYYLLLFAQGKYEKAINVIKVCDKLGDVLSAAQKQLSTSSFITWNRPKNLVKMAQLRIDLINYDKSGKTLPPDHQSLQEVKAFFHQNVEADNLFFKQKNTDYDFEKAIIYYLLGEEKNLIEQIKNLKNPKMEMAINAGLKKTAFWSMVQPLMNTEVNRDEAMKVNKTPKN